MLLRSALIFLFVFSAGAAQAKKADASDAILLQNLMQNSEMSALKTELLMRIISAVSKNLVRWNSRNRVM